MELRGTQLSTWSSNSKVRSPSGTSNTSILYHGTGWGSTISTLALSPLWGTCCKSCSLGVPGWSLAAWCHLWVTLPLSAKYLFGDLVLACGCPTEISQHLCRCQGSGMTNCSSSAKEKSKDAVVRTTSSAGGQAKL